MMPSVSLHQLRLSSYQFERNAKNGQATEEQETGDAKCHTQQRWSEQPASSPCKLQPAGRGRALLRYDDDDEQASGFQKSGQAFGGSSRCWWSTSGQCAHHDGTGKFPLALVRRRMGWSAGLGGGFLSKKNTMRFWFRTTSSSPLWLLAAAKCAAACAAGGGAAVLTTSTLLGRLADSKRRASATSTPHADELQAPSAVSPSFQGR